MPTTAELIELRDVLLKHALSAEADRQYCALSYIFKRHIEEGLQCRYILLEHILAACPSDARNANQAAHRLKGDITLRLDAFYGEGHSRGERPHPASANVKYQAIFKEKGNFLLDFPPYRPVQEGKDWVSAFWSPHVSPTGVAKILYPEPFFMIDERRTFFRNAGMGTQPDASALAYLNIPGTLKTGYSYVPAGIVQALLMLTTTLRQCDNHSPDIPAYEALKPHIAIPPKDYDLIALATPSSTDLVDIIQDGPPMKVDAKGVTFQDTVHNDNERTQWGIVTRTRRNDRVITMLAAKHGRSVETMVQFVTMHKQLILLAKAMNRTEGFHETFQVMFSMSVTNSREGPILSNPMIEAVSF